MLAWPTAFQLLSCYRRGKNRIGARSHRKICPYPGGYQPPV